MHFGKLNLGHSAKHLLLCCIEESKSNGFGTTWNDDKMFICIHISAFTNASNLMHVYPCMNAIFACECIHRRLLPPSFFQTEFYALFKHSHACTYFTCLLQHQHVGFEETCWNTKPRLVYSGKVSLNPVTDGKTDWLNWSPKGLSA